MLQEVNIFLQKICHFKLNSQFYVISDCTIIIIIKKLIFQILQFYIKI